MRYWITIADGARARVFASEGLVEKLELVRAMEHPKGRAHPEDLYTDEPGSYAKGGKQGVRSAMEPGTSAHIVEEERFAHEVAAYLHTAHARREYSQLGLVAPPRFLGLLRQALPDVVRKQIVASIPKDLSGLADRELPKHLARDLVPPLATKLHV